MRLILSLFLLAFPFSVMARGPDQTEEFFSRARTIAWGRVIGGVHHPLDVSAGEILGEKVLSALLENEDFLKDLGNLKP